LCTLIYLERLKTRLPKVAKGALLPISLPRLLLTRPS
jgi:hypothetical protein